MFEENVIRFETQSTKKRLPKPEITRHAKELSELDNQNAVLQAKIDDAIQDLLEICRVGRNPAAGLARQTVRKLES